MYSKNQKVMTQQGKANWDIIFRRTKKGDINNVIRQRNGEAPTASGIIRIHNEESD